MKIKLFITLLIIAGSANAAAITFKNMTGQALVDLTRGNRTIPNNQTQRFRIDDEQTALLALLSDVSGLGFLSDVGRYISASTSEIHVHNNQKKIYDLKPSDRGKVWNITLDNKDLNIKATTTKKGKPIRK